MTKASVLIRGNENYRRLVSLRPQGFLQFKVGDLYPFCFRIADAKSLAGPKAVPAGTDVRTLKDSTGKAYGEAVYAAGQKPEGEITEVVGYLFPKPGTTTPTFLKSSFVTKVGDLGCGVGYYK